MIYILDTHVLIWYFIGSKRLHKELHRKIDEVRNKNGRLLVPTIVLAEALDISEKERITFDFEEMYRLIKEEPEFEIVGFGREVMHEVTKIKEIKEIHDRIISATARFYQVGIMTKDRIIGESGEVEVL